MNKSYLLYGLFGLSAILYVIYMIDESLDRPLETHLTESSDKPLNSSPFLNEPTHLIEQSDLEGYADLNQDKKSERMVLKQDKEFCGSGGCTAFLYNENNQQIARITLVRPPVLVAQSRSHGWQDLIVWSQGAYRLLKHDGQSYPLNPSLAPKIDRDTSIQKVFKRIEATEIYIQDGHSLRYVEPKNLLAPAEHYEFIFDHYGDPFFLYQMTTSGTEGQIQFELIPKPGAQEL